MALHLFRQMAIRHLIVVDGERPTGVLTRKDLLPHVLQQRFACATRVRRDSSGIVTRVLTPVKRFLRSNSAGWEASESQHRAQDDEEHHPRHALLSTNEHVS